MSFFDDFDILTPRISRIPETLQRPAPETQTSAHEARAPERDDSTLILTYHHCCR